MARRLGLARFYHFGSIRITRLGDWTHCIATDTFDLTKDEKGSKSPRTLKVRKGVTPNRGRRYFGGSSMKGTRERPFHPAGRALPRAESVSGYGSTSHLRHVPLCRVRVCLRRRHTGNLRGSTRLPPMRCCLVYRLRPRAGCDALALQRLTNPTRRI